MQEHPVPQNVLEIEFKLFGNFSVRQFTRILLGSALALGVYILNLPPIVSWPIIITIILYSLGSAMIKNFDAKANTLISAVLVSPRYVWRKSNDIPEYLTQDYQQKVVQDGKDKVNKAAGIAVRDLEIDELIRTRTQRREQSGAGEQIKPTPEPSATTKVKPAEELSKVAPVAQPAVLQVETAPEPAPVSSEKLTVTTQSSTDAQPANVPSQPIEVKPQPEVVVEENQADLVLRLSELKGQLLKMQKIGASKVELEIVMKEIDAIYQKLKLLAPDKFAQAARDNYTQVMSQTNYLYGIVVDRKDRPVAGAKVRLLGSDSSVYADVETQPDGRFETARTIPFGSYVVEVAKGGFRFDKFRVVVSDQKLPAYKFRAK